ncbi:hypothetical protein CRG98_029995 [Punica granatum]|uniref:Serine-threonine/tyrosine-protein kinase catalytic domain-containing protein n=1 Tax=Punica granatum TaxID=22663 RepID=A0A2I0J051_PUNGR|nr:hypothetical protein CRG98_029995 [Punica granatum]
MGIAQAGELLILMDRSMDENCNPDEACKYLKIIGLLCTQEMPKLRPSMSTVVGMLKGELDVEGKKISRPGFTAFMGHRTILMSRKIGTNPRTLLRRHLLAPGSQTTHCSRPKMQPPHLPR